MVTRRGDHFYLVVNGATKQGDIDHLRTNLPPAVVARHMKEQALLALQGPKAVDVLARHAPDVQHSHLHDRGAPSSLAAVSAWISRSGYTGEDGFEISVPATQIEKVASLLVAEEEVKADRPRRARLAAPGSRVAAPRSRHRHRTTPVEADLTFALSKRRRQRGISRDRSALAASWRAAPSASASACSSKAASRCAKVRW
jgi:aminomethyltransferase